jgi:hypothetical protein
LNFYTQRYGGQYIGYGSDPPSLTKESFVTNIERLIIASAPLQEFIMKMRRIYLWEDRAQTMKYLIIYLVLWFYNLLLPAAVSRWTEFALKTSL